MAPVTLPSLIDTALVNFPALAYKSGGSRAEAAGDYVRQHGVIFLGNVLGGNDFWQIEDHICTIKGLRCNCRDERAPLFNGGRLCKHRLAAMFVTKLQRAAKDRISSLCLNAPDGVVTLKVEVLYSDKGRKYRLFGHHYPGMKWELYPYDEIYPFDQALFDAALRQHGWGLADRPVRQKNYTFHYFLSATAEAGYTLGMTPGNDMDRAMQEKHFDEIRAMMEIQEALAQ